MLALCAEASLAKVDRVARGATKLRASTSRHQAMSYERIVPKIDQLQGGFAALLAEAEASDREEEAVDPEALIMKTTDGFHHAYNA